VNTVTGSDLNLKTEIEKSADAIGSNKHDRVDQVKLNKALKIRKEYSNSSLH
jgi:hypothetical protein